MANVVVTGLTAARMLLIEAASVVSGTVTGNNLILMRKDGSTIDAGSVRGPQGIQGPPGSITSSPAGGDLAGNYPNPTIGSQKVVTAAIADLAVTDAKVAAANKDGAAGTPSLRTLGTGAAQAAPGNHGHLSLSANAYMDRSASATQAMATGAFTKVLLPVGPLENFTYDSATGIFTVQIAGVYVVTCDLNFVSNGTGRRIVTLWINNSEAQRTEQSTPTGGGVFGLTMTVLHRFAVGDTFYMAGWQSSGADLNTYVTTNSVVMQAVRVTA